MSLEDEKGPAPRDDYEVGYGRPPRQHRFKPGVSGNPRGRPRGARSVETILDEQLAEKVPVKKGGKVRRLSKMELIVTQQVNKAVAGDSKAFDRVMKFLNDKNKADAAEVDQGVIHDEIETLEDLIRLRRSYGEREEDDGTST